MSTLIDIFTSLKSEHHVKEKQASTIPLKMPQSTSSFDLYSKSITDSPTSPNSIRNNSIISNVSVTSDNKIESILKPNPFGIRFLIFSEDSKGRRQNIFDSEGFQHKPRSSPNVTMPTPITNSSRIHSKPATGSNASLNKNKNTVKNEMLMRMVFGGGPMVVSNRTAIKVHSLKNSNKIMISNVFNYYNNHSHVHQRNHIKSDCTCHNRQHRRRGDSLSHSTSKNLNNQRLIESPHEGSNFHKYNRSGTSTSTETTDNNNKLVFNVSSPIKPSNIHVLEKPIQITDKNTKPIDIISSTNDNNNKNVSVSLNNTKSISIHTNQCLLDNSSTRITKTTTTNNNNNPHQSPSSSFISSTSSTNLNQTENSFNSPCSSVPTYYGSYSGIYKRLMRSVSNSLISSTSTAVANLDESRNSESVNLNNETNENGLFKNESYGGEERKTRRISGLSVNSFSTKEADSTNQPWICGKCIDNDRYPKYKIGIAVLFCLPNPSRSNSSTNSTPSASPISTSFSPPSETTPTTQNGKTPIKKQASYDPILMFPSSPPLPTSTLSNEKLSTISGEEIAKNNENFYEFFFSHLPIIEYQIKELKEKLIDNLPHYFNTLSHTLVRNSFSVSSDLTNKCGTCVPPRNKKNMHLTQKLMQASTSFDRKMLLDLDEYEKRFSFLFNSPRLQIPAWLTIMNNRKISQPLVENHFTRGQIETVNLCNNLINEMIYLNKLKKTLPNLQSTPNSKGTKSLFSSLRSSLIKEKTILSKQRNNYPEFLNTIMSTVLKHHLSWVYTVLPANESKLPMGKNSKLRKQHANWTSILEKTNPYNPLWAQLGDLHGAVNNPLKLVRTVVVGNNRETVEKLLNLLSYFIRCGNSSYYDISAEDFDFDKLSSNSSRTSSASGSSNPPNSPKLNELKIDTYQSNFDDDYSNSITNIDTEDKLNSSREVNVFELNIDPLTHITAVLASASAKNNIDEIVAAKQRVNKPARHDEFSYISSLSSSSSITSPSSCSMSSSPLNQNLKVLKKNSTTIPENQTKQSNITTLSSSVPRATALKHRNLSSNSNGENCMAQELPLIGCKLKPNVTKSTRMQDNFGYSLLASFCDEFVFEFVLHGTSDRSFLKDLHERLLFSKRNSIIDCPIEESIYIVIDADDFDVKVYSSNCERLPVNEKPVTLIDTMMKSVLNMIKLFKSSEFVLLHVEDKLQEFYNKAMTLNQLKSQSNLVDNQLLIQLMELDDTADLEFLNKIIQAVDIPNLL